MWPAASGVRRCAGPDIVPETDRVLTFDGEDAEAGARQRDVERSGELGCQATRGCHGQPLLAGIHHPEAFHPTGLKTQYVAAGDHGGDATLQPGPGSRTTMYFFVSDLQVLAPAQSRSL